MTDWLRRAGRGRLWPALVALALLTGALPAANQTARLLAAVSGNPFDVRWTSADRPGTNAMAWGDVDGDGDLDLALGNSNATTSGPSQLYLNSGGALTLAAWAPAQANVTSVAWGDADNDGDLDLALGINGGASLVYRNCSVKAAGDGCAAGDGGLLNSPFWTAPAVAPTSSLAWADVDNDGDLDLALGNANSAFTPATNQISRVYRNCTLKSAGDGCAPSDSGLTTGVLSDLPTAATTQTTAMAWADIDGDGDLDVAVANNLTTSSAYVNCTVPSGSAACNTRTGIFASAAAATFAISGTPSSIAWGDLDNDGVPDLALGAKGSSGGLRVFVNNCPANPATPCTPGFTAQAQTNLSEVTALALGDVNSDGNLDLAAGRSNQNAQYYPGNGDGSLAAPIALSSGDLRAITLADVNGDGSLDLATGNYEQQSEVAVHRGNALSDSAFASWQPAQSPSLTAAWGDVDGDGDLDLAVGNNGAAAVIYRNCTIKIGGDGCAPSASGLSTNTIAVPTPANAQTYSLAWGDVDGDGDLDLAVGNNGQPSRLYINNGASFSQSATWTPAAQSTQSLAWGDADGDGDLDLAVGNNGQPSLIYRNCTVKLPSDGCGAQAGLTNAILWQAAAAAATTSLAWGDVNNDGNLDLALGNYNQPGQLYLGGAGGLAATASADWQPAANTTQSISWGDLNGDGYSDLVLGNYNQRSQIYLNQGGRLAAQPDSGWLPAIGRTSAVALGDVDGDGDTDIVLGNGGDLFSGNPAASELSRLYLNDGAGNFALSAWAPPAQKTFAVALGDANNDGYLDLAVVTQTSATDPLSDTSRVFLNPIGGAAAPLNAPPRVTVSRPGASSGELLSAAQIQSGNPISVTYTLADAESDRVGAVRAFFSLDGGGSWAEAKPSAGTITANLTAAPQGVAHTFGWDTFASGFFGQSDKVALRIQAYPVAYAGAVTPAGQPFGYSAQVAGPFQRPYATGVSAPFRARGTQVRVIDAQSNPVSGAMVYRLPDKRSRGGLPLADAGGTPYRTNQLGYLAGRGTLVAGDRLAALAPQVITDTYTLYFTSDISVTTGLPSYVVAPGANTVQTLTVRSGNPLLAFNLGVAFEWDARNDPAYRQQVKADLRRAGELLYDWTNGQAALGSISLSYNGQNWDTADVRVFATNRLRPSASQGGITTRTYSETVSLAGQPNTLYYTPGFLQMGATWNRYGSATGTAGEDWPRALAHELGHFALNLEDNYIGRDAAGAFIGTPGCFGAMNNPYRDDYSEFAPNNGRWQADCLSTLSARELGRSDWQTIVKWFPALAARQPSGGAEISGPATLALEIATIDDSAGATASAALDDSVFFLTNAGGGYSVAPGARVRAFLFPADGGRVIDLGSPQFDQLNARGAGPGDRICVYDLTSHLSGCLVVQPGLREIRLSAQPASWRPDVIIVPIDEQRVAVNVPAASVVGAGDSPQLRARIYPTGQVTTTVAVTTPTLVRVGDTYSATVSLGEVPGLGYVELWDARFSDPTARPGAVSEFTITGDLSAGKAAQLQGDDKEKKDDKDKKQKAPLAASGDGQMMIYGDSLLGNYYSLQTVTNLPPAPPWSVIVGQAYRLVTSMDAATLKARRVYVDAAYLESELPAGTEGGLVLHYYDAQLARWVALTPSRVDSERNELAAPAVRAGIYALMTRLPVQDGWNMISYPWPQTASIQAATAPLNATPGREFTTIHGYDGKSAAWRVFDSDVPYWVNDLSGLSYGQGYWFLVPPGKAPPALSEVPPSLGVPTPPATIYGFVPADLLGGGQPLEVQALNEGGGVCNVALAPGKVAGDNHLTYQVAVDPAQPSRARQEVFRVQVLPAGQGAPSGCGIMGQRITVVIGGRVVGATFWDNSRPLTFHNLSLPLVFGSLTSAPAAAAADSGSSSPGSDAPWTGKPVP